MKHALLGKTKEDAVRLVVWGHGGALVVREGSRVLKYNETATWGYEVRLAEGLVFSVTEQGDGGRDDS